MLVDINHSMAQQFSIGFYQFVDQNGWFAIRRSRVDLSCWSNNIMDQTAVGSLFVVRTPHAGVKLDTVYICLSSGTRADGGAYHRIYRLNDLRFIGIYWSLDLFERLV